MDFSDPKLLVAVVAVAVIATLVVFRLAAGSSKAKFLNKQRQSVVLGERVNLSHDTVRFRFLLPKSTPVLGLPVGKHFKLFCPNPKGKEAGKWNGREDPEADETEIERKYTPTTSDDEVGYVDLVIKVYKGGVLERFPDGGKMSLYMDTLKVRARADEPRAHARGGMGETRAAAVSWPSVAPIRPGWCARVAGAGGRQAGHPGTDRDARVPRQGQVQVGLEGAQLHQAGHARRWHRHHPHAPGERTHDGRVR
jgi:hypothetical protein